MNLSDKQICHLKDVVTILSAIFALLAAISWAVVAYWGWFEFGNTPMANLDIYLKWQARWNAVAAVCAAVAASLQLSLHWFPLCRAFE
jgi:hypothetical protein